MLSALLAFALAHRAPADPGEAIPPPPAKRPGDPVPDRQLGVAAAARPVREAGGGPREDVHVPPGPALPPDPVRRAARRSRSTTSPSTATTASGPTSTPPSRRRRSWRPATPRAPSCGWCCSRTPSPTPTRPTGRTSRRARSRRTQSIRKTIELLDDDADPALRRPGRAVSRGTEMVDNREQSPGFVLDMVRAANGAAASPLAQSLASFFKDDGAAAQEVRVPRRPPRGAEEDRAGRQAHRRPAAARDGAADPQLRRAAAVRRAVRAARPAGALVPRAGRPRDPGAEPQPAGPRRRGQAAPLEPTAAGRPRV